MSRNEGYFAREMMSNILILRGKFFGVHHMLTKVAR